MAVCLAQNENVFSFRRAGGTPGTPVGAVLGHVALRRIDGEGRTGGRGLAVAGVIIGWVGTGLFALGLGALVVLLVIVASGSGG